MNRLSAGLALLLCACGSTVAPSTTPAEPITTSAPSTTVLVTTVTTTSPTTPPTSAMTTTLSGLPVTLLLAGPGGVVRSDGTQLLAVPAEQAVPDGHGGILYQADGGVWWLPAGAAHSQVVDEAEWLRDVAELEGALWAVVIRSVDDGENSDFLELVSLETGQRRRLAQVGGIEWGNQAVSFAAGSLLVTEINHSCGQLHGLDASGLPLVMALPVSACRVHFEVPFLEGTLSPDGTRVAYVELTHAYDQQLGYPVLVGERTVVMDPISGSELASWTNHDVAHSSTSALNFDGRFIVALRTTRETQEALALVLYDLENPARQPMVVPVTGITDVAFAEP